MTLRGRLMTLFPLLMMGGCFLGIVQTVRTGHWEWLSGTVAFLYLFPPICFRLHQRICPLTEGLESLDTPEYSAWWGGLQIQGIYHAVPALEALLRLVPGVYSAWLRLWGSRIGRGVVWTPRVEISDRSLLEIGDRVTLGHRVAFYAHLVDRREDRLVLYLKRIRIGDDAFIGAGSRLGPGAVVESGCRLPVLTDVWPNQRESSSSESS